MKIEKAKRAVNELKLVLERNNLLNDELWGYIFELKDYFEMSECEEEDRKDTIYTLKAEIKDFTSALDKLINML